MNIPSWEINTYPMKKWLPFESMMISPPLPQLGFGLSGPEGQENWRRYFAQLAVQKLAIIANLQFVGGGLGFGGSHPISNGQLHTDVGKIHQIQTFSKFFLWCVF